MKDPVTHPERHRNNPKSVTPGRHATETVVTGCLDTLWEGQPVVGPSASFPSYPPILPVPSLPIRRMCAPFRDAMLEPETEFYASGVSNG